MKAKKLCMLALSAALLLGVAGFGLAVSAVEGESYYCPVAETVADMYGEEKGAAAIDITDDSKVYTDAAHTDIGTVANGSRYANAGSYIYAAKFSNAERGYALVDLIRTCPNVKISISGDLESWTEKLNIQSEPEMFEREGDTLTTDALSIIRDEQQECTNAGIGSWGTIRFYIDLSECLSGGEDTVYVKVESAKADDLTGGRLLGIQFVESHPVNVVGGEVSDEFTVLYNTDPASGDYIGKHVFDRSYAATFQYGQEVLIDYWRSIVLEFVIPADAEFSQLLIQTDDSLVDERYYELYASFNGGEVVKVPLVKYDADASDDMHKHHMGGVIFDFTQFHTKGTETHVIMRTGESWNSESQDTVFGNHHGYSKIGVGGLSLAWGKEGRIDGNNQSTAKSALGLEDTGTYQVGNIKTGFNMVKDILDQGVDAGAGAIEGNDYIIFSEGVANATTIFYDTNRYGIYTLDYGPGALGGILWADFGGSYMLSLSSDGETFTDVSARPFNRTGDAVLDVSDYLNEEGGTLYLKLGDYNKTNGYGGHFTYDVFLSVAYPVGIGELTVITPQIKTVYEAGEKFNPAGIEVEATLDRTDTDLGNGTMNVPIEDLVFSQESLTAGQTSVTVSYRGKSVEVPITVNAAEEPGGSDDGNQQGGNEQGDGNDDGSGTADPNEGGCNGSVAGATAIGAVALLCGAAVFAVRKRKFGR